MTQIKAVVYTRVSTKDQDYKRQIENLKEIATSKGWEVKRIFAEKISGATKSHDRKEFNSLLEYISANNIKLMLVSEISRLGRKVVDVLNTVEELHSMGVSIYVQQFGMASLDDNGKENLAVKMLMQMLAMGAEMENEARKERQRQGVKIAKANGVYRGRSTGAKATTEQTLVKYKNVVKELKNDRNSLRKVAKLTDVSVNTVRKVKALLS